MTGVGESGARRALSVDEAGCLVAPLDYLEALAGDLLADGREDLARQTLALRDGLALAAMRVGST